MKIKNKDIIALKRKLKLAGVKGLALDVDDTLSGTLVFVIEKLLKELGSPEKLTALEIKNKYLHSNNIPYWHDEAANKVIEDVILVNEKQKELPLIENANKIVQEINKIIPIVAYITVRPTNVIDGTRFWLKKHGFPEAPIIAKPININRNTGNKWKAKVLEYLYPQVVGIVDDNPGLIDFFSKKYKGVDYLYGGAKTERKDIKVIPCDDWETVIKKIEKINDDRG